MVLSRLTVRIWSGWQRYNNIILDQTHRIPFNPHHISWTSSRQCILPLDHAYLFHLSRSLPDAAVDHTQTNGVQWRPAVL
jgi:hypothetical protein